MIDDAAVWADGAQWKDGARTHTVEAAEFCRIPRNALVLDIGCGVCGPARLLVDSFEARVRGVAKHSAMLETARHLNRAQTRWRDSIEIVERDCQLPFPWSGFDVAWSMNMLYQVPDHMAVWRNVHDALKAGGLLFLEDWMLTERAPASAGGAMQQHFGDGYLARLPRLFEQLDECGLTVVDEQDLSAVGRTHMRSHFRREFDRCFRPLVEQAFPAPPHSGQASGAQMSDEWLAAVEHTIGLYERDELRYLRVLARRR
jgi:SAM-dependent methyltransferase